jgi:transcriptional regulator with XRE-family HTH domain
MKVGAPMLLTAAQCLAARELLNCSQMTLANAAGVEIATFLDFELQRRPVSIETLAAIRAALEEAGVTVIESDVRLNPGVCAAPNASNEK